MESPGEEYLRKHSDNDSISPLPATLVNGLIAISVFGLISFLLASTLFLYLTFKLVAWHLGKKARVNSIARNNPEPQSTIGFGFADRAFAPQGQSSQAAHDESVQRLTAAQNNTPNQFLILLFNLIIADMHQGAAFMLSLTWIHKGGIFIDAPTCFVQGLFDSNGDLASSLFITAIAIHTYLSVLRDYRPPQKLLCAVVVGIWIFVYGLAIIPLLATNNGKEVGGYYVRAGPWVRSRRSMAASSCFFALTRYQCWINDAFENLRLLTHYLFVFLSLVTTSVLYVSIYLSLRRQAKQNGDKTGPNNSRVRLSHNPAFLVYPLIYVMCTLPLAVGRIATMAGAHVPMGYYCFAGTLIASNGSFDCLLFGTTRHAIVFGSKNTVDLEDTGLETFSFMRTPVGHFGNTIWIQGGEKHSQSTGGFGGWWQRLGPKSDKRLGFLRTRSLSQESLRSAARNDMAIQMDVVTTVAVEVEDGKERDPRFPDPSMSQTPSLNSGEKHVMRSF
ncbi:hypothetical protein FZEAL_3048 [Fusarium zealandicum]|uniref:G-protein coupled receptors family 1 profile domain-containing protein n=1 Tax=Fusarium zealandicum TaxID=1053134 RepID=A0A8H4UPW4_9HYPO|nr:hypothetical protein FZEAL_3048 [Fusarium zealandicum]